MRKGEGTFLLKVLFKKDVIKALVLSMISILISVPCEVFGQGLAKKPRTIVTTDGEVDDQDSFIRMLL